VLDPVEDRLRLRVLDLEPRDDEGARPVRAEQERDRPLGRREREAGVVEDVVRVEEDDAREPLPDDPLQKGIAARAMLLGRDRDGREHDRGDYCDGTLGAW
jgi:hypothetical protein